MIARLLDAVQNDCIPLSLSASSLSLSLSFARAALSLSLSLRGGSPKAVQPRDSRAHAHPHVLGCLILLQTDFLLGARLNRNEKSPFVEMPEVAAVKQHSTMIQHALPPMASHALSLSLSLSLS